MVTTRLINDYNFTMQQGQYIEDLNEALDRKKINAYIFEKFLKNQCIKNNYNTCIISIEGINKLRIKLYIPYQHTITYVTKKYFINMTK